MGRDSKGRGKSGGRGGGRGSGRKMFIANVEELQLREMQITEEKQVRARRRGDDEDGDDKVKEKEDGDEEVEGEEGKDSVFTFERPSRVPATSAADDDEEEEEEDAPRPKGLLAGITKSNPNLVKKPQDKMMVCDSY
jgi:hypothetical protein